MRLLVLEVQSISDAITNSSSEVFILDSGKTCEEINTILETFTSGFAYPEVFSLKDFRKWRKKLRSGKIEDDWSYPGSIFSIANRWFKDPEDEEDVFELRKDFLLFPYETILFSDGGKATVYSYNYKEEIHDSFIEYLNNNWDRISSIVNSFSKDGEVIDKIDWDIVKRYAYYMSTELEDIIKEFLSQYKSPKPSVWEVDEYDDVRRLDGKVLVVSNDDNSIPYDTWDKINDLFNGRNVHLG